MAGRRQVGLELTKAQAVRLLGLSGRTFERLVQEGAFKPLKRGRSHQPSTFDARALVVAHVARLTGQRSVLDLAEQRALLAQAQRQKIEHDVEVRRAEMVPRRDAEDAWKSHILRARARLLQVPAQARVRGVAAAAVTIVEELLRGALAALSEEDEDAEGVA